MCVGGLEGEERMYPHSINFIFTQRTDLDTSLGSTLAELPVFGNGH